MFEFSQLSVGRNGVNSAQQEGAAVYIGRKDNHSDSCTDQCILLYLS